MRALQDGPARIEATPHETSLPCECHSLATMTHGCRPGLLTLFADLVPVLSLMRREEPCLVHDVKVVNGCSSPSRLQGVVDHR